MTPPENGSTPDNDNLLSRVSRTEVEIDAGSATLRGSLALPIWARGLVVFAHGSDSSRESPRNRFVAEHLNLGRLGTLLLDLLTPEEEAPDIRTTAEHRFDVGLLANRLTAAIDWISRWRDLARLPMGLFGASTDTAAALVTAARRPALVRAVVSHGGNPDLAGDALQKIVAPTLLIVGSNDERIIELSQRAASHLLAPHEIEIVRGATHLFEEPGTLERVTGLAAAWFKSYLGLAAQPLTRA